MKPGAHIKVLCPEYECRRCKRLIKQLDAMLNDLGLHPLVTVVRSLDELVQYNTWILPSVVVNNRVISRGYLPTKQKLMEYLDKDNNDRKSSNTNL